MNTIDKTILLVEDNVDFHALTSINLIKSGYTVKSLFDGNQQEILSLLLGCDLLLLDVDLPSESGATITYAVKHNDTTCDTPVIMMTGNADGESICTAAGADACLIKPFATATLLEKIHDLLMMREKKIA